MNRFYISEITGYIEFMKVSNSVKALLTVLCFSGQQILLRRLQQSFLILAQRGMLEIKEYYDDNLAISFTLPYLNLPIL